jgi:hypothetical protein
MASQDCEGELSPQREFESPARERFRSAVRTKVPQRYRVFAILNANRPGLGRASRSRERVEVFKLFGLTIWAGFC